MPRYSAGGRTNAVTDAAANAIVAQLWNPSTSRTLQVDRVALFKTAAGGNEDLALTRTSARGATPGSTITPGIAQDHQRAVAPPSGAVIETANFATEPTIDGVAIDIRWITAALVGSGLVWTPPEPISILPGAGIAIAELTTTLAVPVCNVLFSWTEP